MINQRLVKELFNYKNGNLYWKIKFSDKINIGQKAGSKSGKYEIIKVNKKNYYTHQLVFLFHNGFIPITVDHKNNKFRDNRIENLREATYSQNLMNTRKLTEGHSKFKGVTWDNQKSKWVARISVNKKRLFLGYFLLEKDAATAYNIASVKHFKQFALNNNKE